MLLKKLHATNQIEQEVKAIKEEMVRMNVFMTLQHRKPPEEDEKMDKKMARLQSILKEEKKLKLKEQYINNVAQNRK